MYPISFFTPVKCGNQTHSWRLKCTEIVDSYFHIKGPVASCLEKSDSGYRVQVKQEPINRLHTALKVVSYMAPFIDRLILALFPRIQTHQGVRQFQTIASCIPLVMLVAKIALRTGLRFYTHNPKVTAWGSQYEKVITTLDNLFGGKGSLDRIPSLDDRGPEPLLVPDDMSEPIMKGLLMFEGRTKAYVAIRMHCLSSQEDVKKKRPHSNSYSTEPQLVFLYQYSDAPLFWVQYTGFFYCPLFFDGNFTYEKDGGVTQSLTGNFALLKNLIANGEGEDSTGVHWKIE